MSFAGQSMMERLSSQGSKLYPSKKLGGDRLIEVVAKIKEDMKAKNINIHEAFRRLDVNNSGLLSFGGFS